MLRWISEQKDCAIRGVGLSLQLLHEEFQFLVRPRMVGSRRESVDHEGRRFARG